jgi:CheY-like chemotaxis protein
MTLSGVTTILVVADDPVQRLLCKTILRQRDFAVITARDGMEGAEMLAAHSKVDLVLTDLHMPRMDGIDLMTRIRATPETAALPVILLTGSSSSGADEIWLRNLGADDYPA